MTTLKGNFAPRILPADQPAPIAQEPCAAGQRVVLLVPDGDTGRFRHVGDYRAVSEVFTTSSGDRVVRVAAESDWYAWIIGSKATLAGGCQNSRVWPAELVRVA